MIPGDDKRASFRRCAGVVIAVGCLVACNAGPAGAAVVFNLGEEVRLEARQPTIDVVYDTANPTVSGGVEATNFPDGFFGTNFDFSPNRLDVTFNVDSVFAGSEATIGTAFNGFRIADIIANIADFTSVTVAPSSTIAFGADRIIGLDIDEVFLDFQGIEYTSSDVVSFDFNGGPATAVPEPGGLALLGLIGSVVVCRRLRRPRAAA